MKLSKGLKIDILEAYGFTKMPEDEPYVYEYDLGHSRRGQFYSIFVDQEGNFYLNASEPDGSGAPILLDDPIFFKLIKYGIVVYETNK